LKEGNIGDPEEYERLGSGIPSLRASLKITTGLANGVVVGGPGIRFEKNRFLRRTVSRAAVTSVLSPGVNAGLISPNLLDLRAVSTT